MPYEDELDSSLDIPTLTDMTAAALDFLKVKVSLYTIRTELLSSDNEALSRLMLLVNDATRMYLAEFMNLSLYAEFPFH
jgi:hypothetical protein